jgi:predicted NAD/FAD-dependent oxidoreductase
MTLDYARIAAAFAAAVNMSADELEAWLETPESKRVGFKPDGGESVGHASGRRIVRLLREGPAGEDDYRHMRKTVGFVRRHRAQEPANMVTSRWRYSLMNWGHDPLK